ncbi:BQ5605_C006g04106 [Microbotryum silenes-dioicae]|uniref:ATP-dependent DNA helicase n=1 Tax=Microbotryum silenes-dioicae TaxID=796604 RepID=A0A2X0M5Z3_9BASI|nr:BQ5605_C006g04106 [Microbotryum silenes-dioicae]
MSPFLGLTLPPFGPAARSPEPSGSAPLSPAQATSWSGLLGPSIRALPPLEHPATTLAVPPPRPPKQVAAFAPSNLLCDANGYKDWVLTLCSRLPSDVIDYLQSGVPHPSWPPSYVPLWDHYARSSICAAVDPRMVLPGLSRYFSDAHSGHKIWMALRMRYGAVSAGNLLPVVARLFSPEPMPDSPDAFLQFRDRFDNDSRLLADSNVTTDSLLVSHLLARMPPSLSAWRTTFVNSQGTSGTLPPAADIHITLTSDGPEGRLWWMYQHTVVSAAPACGVGVPIRSHVQALCAPTHPTTTSSCAKARKGERAGLESRSNPSSPTFSQGKVQLPPPLRHNPECRQLREGSDSALRENARSYNNDPACFACLIGFTPRLGVQIPVVNQRSSLCSNVADRPSRHRHSTWTQRRRQSHTKAYFDQARVRLAQAGDTAKEWVLRLCLPPGRDRRTHNLPTSSTEMAMLICDSDTNTGDRGPQDLILQVHGDRCPDGRPKYQIMASTPTWPEIKAALGPNDKACNRPDLIARVFEAKLNRLCDDVFGNKQRAGCFGVVLTHTHVIEYQKRGLPHAHILITLAPDDHPLSTEAMDKTISAEIPDPSRYPDLHETVTKHMLHSKCGGNSTQPCMQKDKYGYPLYRRRFRHAVVKGGVIYNDGDCVPYSPYLCANHSRHPRDLGLPAPRTSSPRFGTCTAFFSSNYTLTTLSPPTLTLLLSFPSATRISSKYNAHINVEAVTTIGAIKYLFKYVYKGPDRAVARVERAANGEGAREDEPVRDEINEFVEGRYISAPEAVHRLFGFSVGRVWPPVNRLPVHLENQQSVQINPNEPLPLDTPPTRSKLTGFFDLCAAAPDGELTTTLLYTNVPRYYSWNKEKLRWKRRVHDCNVIGRIYTVPLRSGECFYLRLLLEVVMGPTSFADLLMFEDVVYPSYRAARGLLADDGEHHICLREAAQIETGDQLRRLFVFMLIHATVANPPALLDRHFASLSDDARYHIKRYEDVPVNNQTIRLWTLNKIRLLLAANNRTLAFFDLPELTEDEVRLFDRLEERLPRFDRQQCAQDAEAAHARLNHDQRIAFDECLCAVELDVVDQMRDNNLGPQHVFFLLAPGGTGKTFVENALLDTVRARGDQAIAVASSGVAALLLKGGHTAHSTFRIPLDTLPTSTCPVNRESDLALMLCTTKLIIWDEAPMAHRFAVEAVDRLLRDLQETEEHFGGVTMIFAGTPGQIVDASLIKADFWRDVRVLRLTENMRLSSNADAMDEAQLAQTRDFAEWLLTVGDGTANMHPYDKIALPDYLLLPDGQRTAEGLINFVYSGLRTVNKESLEDLIQLFSRQAILAPHNATVDRINAKLLEEFNGDYIEYRSADEVVEAGKTGGGMAPELILPEYLHSINPSNFPAHHLRLKEGIPVVLLRNLDPDAGLCNGTRLIVSHARSRVIQAIILTGDRAGTTAPRRQLGFTMRRLQFPLRVALAMTINKAQGQSLDCVGVDLSLHPVLLPSRDPADDDDDLQAVDRAAAAATATPNPVFHSVLRAMNGE